MTKYLVEKAIVDEAFEAAVKAAAEFRAKYGELAYCGFAWVNIQPGNSRIAKYLKEIGKGSKSYTKGLDVWNPSGDHTQSMDIKEAGAGAFAKVLQSHGISAFARSRAD